MKPIIEVTTNRYSHLILFPFGAGAAYFCFWASFLNEEPFFEDDAVGNVVLIAFIFVGLLICFFSIKGFVTNKPLFTIYEDGFIANTHGVASHKVLWKDISRIEDKIITDSDGKTDRVLAVFFKDPNYFAYSKSRAIGALVRLGTIGKAFSQGEFTETEAPLLVPGYSLGDKFHAIKAHIEQQLVLNNQENNV